MANEDPRDAIYCDPEDRKLYDEPEDLREYDNDEHDTIMSLRGEISELRAELKTFVKQHKYLKQQFVAAQKNQMISHQRIIRLMHLTEGYKDFIAAFREILAERKGTMPVKLTTEQLELISTKSFLDVADQLDMLRFRFIDQQEKFNELINWVTVQFGGVPPPFNVDKPLGKPLTINKLKKNMSIARDADFHDKRVHSSVMSRLMAKPK